MNRRSFFASAAAFFASVSRAFAFDKSPKCDVCGAVATVVSRGYHATIIPGHEFVYKKPDDLRCKDHRRVGELSCRTIKVTD